MNCFKELIENFNRFDREVSSLLEKQLFLATETRNRIAGINNSLQVIYPVYEEVVAA